MSAFELKNNSAPESSGRFRDDKTIRVILGRRSVRAFEPRPVEAEKVEILLECAFAAPSSMNIQPCHLVLIDDKTLMAKIGAASERTRMAGGAPLAIGVCVDVANYEKAHKLTDGTWMEDSACVMENILISARALGLEGVWLQIANRPEREATVPPLLHLPEGVRLLAMALLGYGTEHKASHSGVDAARLHRNGW
ncbi:MAG: nitroreductase family protein [Synergistaceae bacterium]|jgi:nitroreductase|nr:nitroreductase family protein [Synergistaceae bacterium]